MEAFNLDIETSEKASDCAPEEGFSRSQDAMINGEHLNNEANETNETIKNEVSNERKHLEVAISDSRAEERWCETTIEANETRKNEVSNEELPEEKDTTASKEVQTEEEEEEHESAEEVKTYEETGEMNTKIQSQAMILPSL
ncbi:hypothetical protein ACE6H2_012498 [Prunus campanulata]